MTKRLFLLNGLAILAVVCNHAAAWGYTALFWWPDRYRPVTVPNFDQFGSLPYYGVVVVRQLTVFSVPAFLFVSGFFAAFAARGSQSALNWKMVRVRITNLLIPYLIWSVAIFVGEALEGITYAPTEYLENLALGRADPAYAFVLVLCQLYLLSPWIISLARAKGRLLLLLSAFLQLGATSTLYLYLLLGTDAPAVNAIGQMMPYWLFVRWIFYFSCGAVSAFQLQQLKGWLVQAKWGLLVAVVVLGPLVILEAEMIFRITGQDFRGGVVTISAGLYAVAFILCFLAFHQVRIPFAGIFHYLGRRSYGIYLLHGKVLEFSARVIRQILPLMLAHQALFQPVLVILGVGMPLLFMVAVARSPAQRLYRYLFG